MAKNAWTCLSWDYDNIQLVHKNKAKEYYYTVAVRNNAEILTESFRTSFMKSFHTKVVIRGGGAAPNS